ncbi:MAG: hypothetical protein ACHQ52_12805, partial [Candidatus Eisenbacteria bacterium]
MKSLRVTVLAVALAAAAASSARAGWNPAGVLVVSMRDGQIDQPLVSDLAGGVYLPYWTDIGIGVPSDAFLVHLDHGGDGSWPSLPLTVAFGGAGA